jgi:hypothetical protein
MTKPKGCIPTAVTKALWKPIVRGISKGRWPDGWIGGVETIISPRKYDV